MVDHWVDQMVALKAVTSVCCKAAKLVDKTAAKLVASTVGATAEMSA